MTASSDLRPLRRFIRDMTLLVEHSGDDEATMLAEGRTLLAALVGRDGWLPEAAAVPHPERYQQYLLHCDPLERFSLVSFVWGPGQMTPVHDHTVWGLVGMLRGAEICQPFEAMTDGTLRESDSFRLEPGDVCAVGPSIGDVHKVMNAYDDRVSISVHAYGGNIGSVARHVFNAATGEPRPFVSGYSNDLAPNLWDHTRDPA